MNRSKRIGRARSHLSFANVVALVALFVALGGSAYAAAKIDTGDIANKAVTGKKVDSKTLTAKNFESEAVKTGKIKDEAVSTEKLQDGAVTNEKQAHPAFWAVAEPNALLRGNGALSVTRINAGNYRVEFETDVSQCAYQVTGLDINENRIGHADSDVTNANRVFVSIRNAAGVRTDADYSLAVTC